MPGNIIADTSCLILLEKIGELDLLNKLFDLVIISPVVAEEYGLSLPAWIKVEGIRDKKYQKLLEHTLDPGEASVIALAVEIGGLLILDDSKARRLASELKLDYTGTLGILVDAKQRGYIHSFKSILEKIKQTNFHLTEELEGKLLDMTN